MVARDSRDGSTGRGRTALKRWPTPEPATPPIERALALPPLAPGVPDAARTRELARALDVRRNARLGFGSGVVLAIVAYAFRVGELAGPTADTRGSPALFLLLAFVLAVSVGMLVTAALTVRTALTLARQSDADPDSE